MSTSYCLAGTAIAYYIVCSFSNVCPLLYALRSRGIVSKWSTVAQSGTCRGIQHVVESNTVPYRSGGVPEPNTPQLYVPRWSTHTILCPNVEHLVRCKSHAGGKWRGKRVITSTVPTIYDETYHIWCHNMLWSKTGIPPFPAHVK